jgi:hypothetical protein
MTSTDTSVPDQCRRESLKKFARYAAAAPAAMVLLEPRESLAKKRKGQGKGKGRGWGKGGDSHY